MIAVFCGLNHVLFASAQNPIIFPTGAKSFFMGHSFFIPIAEQFNFFASSQSGAFPDHEVQVFKRGGEYGSPLNLWLNNKQNIEPILATGQVELFGMVISPPDAEDPQIDDVLTNDNLNAYRDWIDLALGYNSNTSIFIGQPWSDFPASFDNATSYMDWLQEGDDAVFGFINTLRAEYPDTDIHFLNYGIVAGEMRNLFEQDELVGIIEMIKDQANRDSCLFVDEKGHAGNMLKELAALTWLIWFYGAPVNLILNAVDQILGWDKQNTVDIFSSVGENNEDFRLYETTP